MRELIRGLAIGLVLLALAGVLPRSGGTAPWLLSRVSGLTAFVALALDASFGLLVSAKLANRVLAKGAGVELHRWLSPLALALVLAHVVLLLADGYVRFDAVDVLVPFASGYRPIAVGIGVIGAYIAFVVHASFGLRRRLGARTWRRLHYLSFVAVAAAAAHGLLAGTDAARPWVIAMFAVPLAAVVALAGVRLVRARAP